MRRLGSSLIRSLKDQARVVRYSIRAEAETPGAALPKMIRDIDFGPLTVIRSFVGTPAVRLADSVFSQVESIASGVLPLSSEIDAPFPCVIGDYFGDRDAGGAVGFSDRLYGHVKRMLRGHGARNMLVSEQAFDAVWAQVRARHGDTYLSSPDVADRPGRRNEALVQVCAGITCAFADVRPIRRVEFDHDKEIGQHFMLSPNLYCGLVIGLATAVVTLDPALVEDREAVIESVDSAVDARFGRFRQATTSKSPIVALAQEFQAILPFMP